MRIVLIASGEFALPSLHVLHKSYDIACVYTQPDRPSGRGRHRAPTPVKRAAVELGLHVVEAASINDPAIVDAVASAGVDVGVVIAFGQRIGQAFRDACRGGCINLHASLLPKYRGAAPFQWAVIRGESETGVTVFKLVDRMDAGAVLSQRRTPIEPLETASDLHHRLAKLGPAALQDALQQFAGGNMPAGRLQDESRATRAPKLSKDDGLVNLAIPVRELACLIRGLWSWPGAACRFRTADGSRDEPVTLARARAVEDAATPVAAGTLDGDLLMSATGGRLEIIELKPQGGKLMSWRDFVNGRRVRPGDRLVSARLHGGAARAQG